MRGITLTILLFLSLLQNSIAQSGIKDSLIRFPFFSVGYGVYQPGGDLKERFGTSSMLSGTMLFKTSKNFVYGISGGFIFGDNVEEKDLLKGISTPGGQVIGLDGLYAD